MKTIVEETHIIDGKEVVKKMEYTWDEKKYSSVEECIADHAKKEQELKEAGEIWIEENKKLKEEYLIAYEEWRKSEPVFKEKPFDPKPYLGRGYENKQFIE